MTQETENERTKTSTTPTNDDNIPEVLLEYVNPNDLKEDLSNPNIMSQEEKDAVISNIQKFGWLVPIIINDNYEVADGEHRKQIALELGYKKVPCIKSSKLNDDIARRIVRQALNKVRGHHDAERDIQEIEKIYNSKYKNAASILQDVALISKGWFQQMKRTIATGGIYEKPEGVLSTVVDEEGRVYDRKSAPRYAESYLTNAIKQIVLYFTAEEFEVYLTKLLAIGDEMGVKNNTEIFVKLLEHYESCPNRERKTG